MESGRRAFLRGRAPAAVAAPFRPPWAVAEERFRELCIRCDRCVVACPTKLLVRGGGGFPEADFSRSHCTFCGDCRAACHSGALDRSPEALPWSQAAAIGEGCLARQAVVCRTCGERCEEGAIRFVPRPGGVALPALDPDKCTGCGECIADCPTRAIALVRPQPPSPPGAQP